MHDKTEQDNSANKVIKRADKAKPPSHGRVIKKAQKITESYLHNAGLYYLQRFASSTTQFRRVMKRKIDKSCQDHPDQDKEACLLMLETLIEKFVRSGLLNDDLYTASTVRSLRTRGTSQKAIITKMATKGIAEDQARKALKSWDEDSGHSDIKAALTLARKKRLGPYFKGDKAEASSLQNKWLSSMARAGFDFETARKVLTLTADDLESFTEKYGL